MPTWEELERNEEQLDVLEWPLDKPLFVAGPPGSGKTVLAVHRAQMLAEREPDIVVVTYNRMLRRLMVLLFDAEFTGAVATMQSYVWNDYRRRGLGNPPTSPQDPYAYVWSEMLSVLEEREPCQIGRTWL